MAEKTEPNGNGKTVLVTPTGKCEWAKILKPDTKWNSDGEYSIDLFLGEEESAEIVAGIRTAVKKLQDSVTADGHDTPGYANPPFTKTETGYKFKFKQKAKGGDFDFTVDVYDAATKEWPKDLLIGNGSTVKVAYEYYAWNVKAQGGVGCTLRLKAVQIIKHVEYVKDAKSFGFTAEEGTKVDEAEAHAIAQEFEDSRDVPF